MLYTLAYVQHDFCVGDLTLHSPRRASMAGSVPDVTAHLLDDAQPDAMSQAEPLAAQEIVGTAPEVVAPVVAGLPVRPVGEFPAHAKHVRKKRETGCDVVEKLRRKDCFDCETIKHVTPELQQAQPWSVYSVSRSVRLLW